MARHWNHRVLLFTAVMRHRPGTSQAHRHLQRQPPNLALDPVAGPSLITMQTRRQIDWQMPRQMIARSQDTVSRQSPGPAFAAMETPRTSRR
jgi:hypothetical protein